jgi:lipopolysaccharide transport system ATP-binding protein
MADPVITIDSVSKRYELGTTFGDSLSQRMERAIRSPFRRAKHKRERAEARDANEFWALRDVTFEVTPGEVLGLVGDNGAGKSTLLKLLSQITLPTSGEITMQGRIGSLLEVGTGFHPELTGRENVFLNGAVLGMRRQEIIDSFDEIVEFSGITQFLDTPVKRYSSGMYVRLAFAVAAHLQPEIMLIDEVLAVGDQEFQRKCLGKMDDAARSGRTVIFVSHNLSAIQRLCDRTVWLSKGEVAGIGRTREVVTDYLREVEPEEAAGEIDLTERAHRLGTGEARLLKLRMLDESGRPTTSLRLGEPFSFVLEFELPERIHELVAMLGISSADGARVFQTISADSELGPLSLEPGVHEIELKLDQPLQPGEYHVDVGVFETDNRALDFVERAMHFGAVNVAHDESQSYPWAVSYGYLRPRAAWSVASPVAADAPALDPEPNPSTPQAR